MGARVVYIAANSLPLMIKMNKQDLFLLPLNETHARYAQMIALVVSDVYEQHHHMQLRNSNNLNRPFFSCFIVFSVSLILIIK